jgi:predicted small secreted protein
MRKAAFALVMVVLLPGAAALLSACNTMEGIGKDTVAAAHALTGSSDKPASPTNPTDKTTSSDEKTKQQM